MFEPLLRDELSEAVRSQSSKLNVPLMCHLSALQRMPLNELRLVESSLRQLAELWAEQVTSDADPSLVARFLPEADHVLADRLCSEVSAIRKVCATAIKAAEYHASAFTSLIELVSRLDSILELSIHGD